MKKFALSIVIQGPFDSRRSELGVDGSHTASCIAAVRSQFRDAELIFSTWKSPPTEVADLCDKVILNEDPGSLLPAAAGKNFLANFNRQLVTTKSGLMAATAPYALKLRSDSWLVGRGFYDIYRRIENDSAVTAQHFQKPILVCALGCADPVVWPSLYHLTDLFHFGRTADLLRLWSVDFCPANYAEWHNTSSVSRWRRGGEGRRPERLAPEQYLHCAWLSQNLNSEDIPEAILGGSRASYVRSEISFIRNFRAIPSRDLGFMLPKRLREYDHEKHFSYRADWKRLEALSSDREVADYVDGRYSGFVTAQILACVKHGIRPMLGKTAKERLARLLDFIRS